MRWRIGPWCHRLRERSGLPLPRLKLQQAAAADSAAAAGTAAGDAGAPAALPSASCCKSSSFFSAAALLFIYACLAGASGLLPFALNSRSVGTRVCTGHSSKGATRCTSCDFTCELSSRVSTAAFAGPAKVLHVRTICSSTRSSSSFREDSSARWCRVCFESSTQLGGKRISGQTTQKGERDVPRHAPPHNTPTTHCMCAVSVESGGSPS